MNFSSMLCLALANAEGFMSSWKAQDQEVPATNDLMEIEDLTLTAPSPLQRLLSDEDDEEQEEEKENQTDEDEEEEDEEEEEEEEDEDDDGNDKWSTPQVAVGAGGAGLLVGGGIAAGLVGKWWKSSPEKRLAIVTEKSLETDQITKLNNDDKVEYAVGTQIISTYKTPDAFTAAHPGVAVTKSEEQDKGTWVKCGETFYESTANNTWKPQETGAEETERLKKIAADKAKDPTGAPAGTVTKKVAAIDAAVEKAKNGEVAELGPADPVKDETTAPIVTK